MPFLSAQVTPAADTPTILMVKGTGDDQFNNIGGTIQDPTPVRIKNLDDAILVYIGGPDVTVDDGYPLGPAEFIDLRLLSGDVVYALAASGTPLVGIFAGRQ